MIRKLKPALPDSRLVDTEDLYAMELWSKEFKVSREKIMAAVLAAGTSAPDVKRELKIIDELRKIRKKARLQQDR